MKTLFDQVSHQCSKLVTESYSTSFSLATRMLSNEIRQDIYNIYGFVRFADEIVDTFHQYDKPVLFERFEQDLEHALQDKISLNPILNSFQETVHKYNLDREHINAFMQSMKWDLSKKVYNSEKDYKQYIYGSADVVGLMCLKVFVKGDELLFDTLKESAMALGSAFQKVNFLRDLKDDFDHLERTYFPNVDMNCFDENSKQLIIAEIEADFKNGLSGIFRLPDDAKFGVYTAYKYYMRLLKKLKRVPSTQIKSKRIRVPNYQKADVLARSFIRYQFNVL
ncbi:MAG: phytoene/squalene synthase family protein [Bacteroidetes bacterium]|nr:phytoene/squalene synthase family protein [Bacteroidota bacterium]MDA0888324.1 phytoene/squalene synthase family protein [Bacteroidota bacterium]MDA1084641.1 phytoene/squalene synthase family protein [Bacteroidota bacterium]